MEHGGLKDTGAMDYTINSFNSYIRSSMLIRVNDAAMISGKTLSSFFIFQYASDFSLIGQKSSVGNTFTFASNCRYIKICKQTLDNIEDAIFLFDGDVEEAYNVQMESGTYTDGSLTRLYSETLVFKVDEKACTTARLLLPSTYSVIGRKVPLIIWCGCDGSYPNWNYSIDFVGSSPSSITSQLQYLASEGFAVLNVYPWGSYNFSNFPNCGQSGALPVPVTLRAYEKAVEYVTTRFNISDTNIFMSSWSGSGKLSSYYAIQHPSFSLRHVYAFSPVIDGLCYASWRSQFTDMRKALLSEMNFVGDSSAFTANDSWTIRELDENNQLKLVPFIQENAGKFAKCSAINWINMTEKTIEEKMTDTAVHGAKGYSDDTSYNRYNLSIMSDGTPITIIGASDDTACPYRVMKEFVTMLLNGGAEAEIVTMPNGKGGHGAPIRDTTLSGDGSPYGWWYMVQDIKARFLKNS